MKTEAFENGDGKKRQVLSLPSALSGVLLWTITEMYRRLRFQIKTLVWAKLFCFIFVEKKTESFKNSLVWSWPDVLLFSCKVTQTSKPIAIHC